MENSGDLKLNSLGLDDLNRLVTEQIEEVNRLTDTGEESQSTIGHSSLSLTEEAIARHPDTNDTERYYARRGAIRAAFIAGESQRAEDLCQEFGMTLAEFGL